MPYDFKRQLAKGESGEQFLDEFFESQFDVLETPHLRAVGVDREFRRKPDGRTFEVEYKTDFTAGDTGNAFIETISVDTENKLGWVCTSRAAWILYFVPGRDELYLVRLSALRAELPRFIETLSARQIPNSGYHTHGLLLPLKKLGDLATGVVHVSGGAGAATRAAALMTTSNPTSAELVAAENARLYDELTEAADARDWAMVRRRAENILTLTPDDSVARSMYVLSEGRVAEESDRSKAGVESGAERQERVKKRFPKAWEPWTTEDDEQLAALFSDGRGVATISETLMRTPGAIGSRLRKLRIAD